MTTIYKDQRLPSLCTDAQIVWFRGWKDWEQDFDYLAGGGE